MVTSLLLLPAPAAPRRRGRRNTVGKTDHRFGIGLRRRITAAAPSWRRPSTRAGAPGCGPAVACGTILHHARVSAEDIAIEILCPRVAEILAVLQCGVADCDQRILV